jgi:hypothetical protein
MISKRILFSLILAIVSLPACTDPFDEEKKNYEPWYFEAGPDKLYVLKDLTNKIHYDKVEQVLEYYCVDYHRVGPTQIEFTKSETIDMIMNYRSKAEDQTWWAQHIEGQHRECHDKNKQQGT